MGAAGAVPRRAPGLAQRAFAAWRQPAREDVTPYRHELRLQAAIAFPPTGLLREFSDRSFLRISAGPGRGGGNCDLFLQDADSVHRQNAGAGKGSAGTRVLSVNGIGVLKK